MCVRAFVQSAEGSDIIPFRESKLTHLLMPLLSRAGLNGVAMITCVNPQPDDYDETLSILGAYCREEKGGDSRCNSISAFLDRKNIPIFVAHCYVKNGLILFNAIE